MIKTKIDGCDTNIETRLHASLMIIHIQKKNEEILRKELEMYKEELRIRKENQIEGVIHRSICELCYWYFCHNIVLCKNCKPICDWCLRKDPISAKKLLCEKCINEYCYECYYDGPNDVICKKCSNENIIKKIYSLF